MLVALIETLLQLAENDAAPVWAALRDMMNTEEPFSAYVEKRDARFEMPGDLGSAAAGAGTDFPPQSHNGRLILETAREFAMSTSHSELVSIRHLFAALLYNPEGSELRA